MKLNALPSPGQQAQFVLDDVVESRRMQNLAKTLADKHLAAALQLFRGCTRTLLKCMVDSRVVVVRPKLAAVRTLPLRVSKKSWSHFLVSCPVSSTDRRSHRSPTSPGDLTFASSSPSCVSLPGIPRRSPHPVPLAAS
jgi:hypothetical protein